MSGIFVTGTDTGVGKTVIACALLRAAASCGLRAAGMKPVAAGIAPGAAANADVGALIEAASVDAPLADVNPYGFERPIAPHVAATNAGVAIDLARIEAAYRRLEARAELIVVEGAGGALVPLSRSRDMLDVASAIGAPVLLVVGIRLGCLNHALMTEIVLRQRGLVLAGWIANRIDPAMEAADTSVAALEERLAAPLLADFAFSTAPIDAAAKALVRLFKTVHGVFPSPRAPC